MLDTETKRRIDTARDILVGKVPDPKSQVEQITIALIYKFMDDMDAEAEELGGARKFFNGEFAKYGWAKLMSPAMGGHEVLNLYGEAITKMTENEGIPPLFRDIFKNAYLPYRDPETLKSFLKIIDDFEYDHSERLGDAFEYLLSVLGAQGDAGQFRTPRHIIDFMVQVIDPKKDESVLDPACGTAGFLISAYKHILKANSKNGKTGAALTPDQRKTLTSNIKGYDISPDMVRLSLVNLYLHGFTNPHIAEYDTLTSEDNWNEHADIVLANPPFMSPKGGIKPHKRFSIQAKRSEVLFVDYIAEHLTPNGRAAVIVPEGIIFQSQNAYKQLREMLVKNYLYAVVSLPAGVFQPYSGVKTSILLMDKALAKKCDSLLFVKLENDGFDLGAQRRKIDKDDLPETLTALQDFHQSCLTGEDFNAEQYSNVLKVEKEKIGENGEWNLSGERYRENDDLQVGNYDLIELGEVAEVISGQSPAGEFYNDKEEGTPFYQGKTEFSEMYIGSPKKWTTQVIKTAFQDDILMSVRAPVGPVNFATQEICIGRGLAAIRANKEKIFTLFLFQFLKASEDQINGNDGAAFSSINRKDIQQIKIPLPPLKIQQEIVAEIEGYQKIIDGARSVVDNYKPQIQINPDWEMVKFKDAPFLIIDGDRGVNYPKKEDFSPRGYCLFLTTKNVRADGFVFNELQFINQEKDQALRKGKLERGDVLLTTRGTVGNTAIYDDSVEFDQIRINSGMLIFRPKTNRILSSFLFHFYQSDNFTTQRDAIISGAAQPQLPIKSLNDAELPLPSIETQKEIVTKIEKEQSLVNANKELITLFEHKIKDKIASVWGE